MHFLDRLRTFRDSFLMVPLLFIVVSIVLAQIMIALDHHFGGQPSQSSAVLFAVGPDGARGMLSAIASTILSVATMAFSITISVMSSVSSSFGPRIVRNFMADRSNQVVLGVFTATFLYSLLVMRSIHGAEISGRDEAFVPHIAVNFSVFLAVICVGMLIYFINHIASSIQVSRLASGVQSNFLSLVDSTYHSQKGEDKFVLGEQRYVFESDGVLPVLAAHSGNIRSINYRDIAEKLNDENCTVKYLVAPGDYVVEGEKIALLHTPFLTNENSQKIMEKVESACSIGSSRTVSHDIRFAEEQLLELGIRALSPGTNDPFTLTNATRELTVGLVRATQGYSERSLYYLEGQPLVWIHPISPAELINHAFDLLRPYAIGHASSVIDLLVMAGKIYTLGEDAEARARCQFHAAVLLDSFRATNAHQHDKSRVENTYRTYFAS